MTDPNQPNFFVAKKNGKMYKHRNRHQANERQVDLDIFKGHFKERHGREMTKEEFQVFNTAFNLGYKEGKKRTTQNHGKVKA